MRTRIAKWGNSLGLRIPKVFIADSGLGDGAEVEVTLEGGRIVITPLGRHYPLGELVEGITPENRHGETDWGRPTGNEVW